MDVTGTIHAGVAKAARCVKNGVDNYKTDGKIAEQQKKMILTKLKLMLKGIWDK